ncbi:MAG: signal peptidase I [Candidatus Micrarchaeaceae archaeon]
MTRSTVYVVCFILVAILLVFRFTGLPFGVFFVVGKSMEPSLYAGDLAVVLGKDYGVGDVVVWSYGGFSCIIHRVVNVSSSYIITRGDSNPVDDPPVPVNAVKGKMIFHVPRVYWISFLLIVFGMYVFFNRKHFVLESFEKSSSTVFLTMVLVMFSIMVFSPIMSPNVMNVKVPSLHLSSLIVDSSTGDVIVKYSLDGLWLENVTGCMISSKSCTMFCSAESRNDTIIVHVPRDYYSVMNEVGEKNFFIRLNASLSYNTSLFGNYIVYPVFSRLRLEKFNAIVKVFNPNIFPIKVNVTIYFANEVGVWETESKVMVVGSGERVAFDLSDKKFSYFQIQYIFIGKTITEKVRVTFNGKF